MLTTYLMSGCERLPLYCLILIQNGFQFLLNLLQVKTLASTIYC